MTWGSSDSAKGNDAYGAQETSGTSSDFARRGRAFRNAEARLERALVRVQPPGPFTYAQRVVVFKDGLGLTGSRTVEGRDHKPGETPGCPCGAGKCLKGGSASLTFA